MLRVARLMAGIALAGALAAPTAHAATQPRVHYAGAVRGSDAYIAFVRTGQCFKAYLSDGTEKGATLSVWFFGCATDDRLALDRRGTLIDAQYTRTRVFGTVTLRDHRTFSFNVRSGFGDGLVARNFKGPDGVSYRSGWIVLRDNSVRGRTMIVTHALYGDVAYGPGVERTPPFDESAPPDEHAAACARVAHDREVLRVQNGRLSSQSGTWERRINLGRGPTSATYNRLSQAMGALDELIFTLERRLYSCS